MIQAAILAALPAGGGPAPYHADAVQTDGSVTISIEALTTLADNGLFSLSYWVKYASGLMHDPTIWVVDPLGLYASNENFEPEPANGLSGGMGDGSSFYGITGLVPADTWANVIRSFNTNFAPGSRLGKCYVNDVDVTDVVSDSGSSPFQATINGQPFYFLNDTFGFGAVCEIADARFLPNVSLLDGGGDIPLATRRLFIDGSGKPVDPAVATASLGAPCMLFSGNASTFGTNQGTGGAFTTTGTLTNASTSPSD